MSSDLRLGSSVLDRGDVIGYRVRSPDGRRLGNVVAASPDEIVIETRRFVRRSRYTLSRAFTLVRDDERTVLLTVSRKVLFRSREHRPPEQHAPIVVLPDRDDSSVF